MMFHFLAVMSVFKETFDKHIPRTLSYGGFCFPACIKSSVHPEPLLEALQEQAVSQSPWFSKESLGVKCQCQMLSLSICVFDTRHPGLWSSQAIAAALNVLIVSVQWSSAGLNQPAEKQNNVRHLHTVGLVVLESPGLSNAINSTCLGKKLVFFLFFCCWRIQQCGFELESHGC